MSGGVRDAEFDAKIEVARTNFHTWLTSLPVPDDGGPVRVAQERVLAKLNDSDDREALFWFAVSLLNHFLDVSSGLATIFPRPDAKGSA